MTIEEAEMQFNLIQNDLREVNTEIESDAHMDFINQLKLFTKKQDIRNIRPYGIQKTVLLRE